MIEHAGRSIRARPGRAAGLAVGLLVAAVSFTLLTAATSRSQARIRGTVSSSFRTSYDILVRPVGSRSELERSQGLVRDNFESGQFGGISRRQWQRILHLPGVSAAAPVANLGWFLQATRVKIPVSKYVPDHGDVLLRLRSSWLANGGLSVYPGQVEYLYVTSRRDGCNGRILLGPPNDQPFTWGTPRDASLSCVQRPAHGDSLTVVFSPEFPVLIAAIDPVQENKLLALDSAVVSGDPLHEGAGPIPNTTGCCGPSIPVLVSDRSYEREPLNVTVERVEAPPGTTLSKLLLDPALQEKPGHLPGPPTDGPNKPFQHVTKLPGRVLGHQTIASREIYQHLLDTLVTGGFPTSDYWTTSPVTYQQRRDGTLAPRVVRVDPKTTWVDPNAQGGYAYMPLDSADVAFRQVSPHPALPGTYNGISGITGITTTAVGEFDPTRIGRSGSVNRVPLEAYSPPIARPADPASRAALHGRPLAPTKQIGGYLAPPPFMLTTLTAAQAFLDPDKFQNTRDSAPISIIRVKVAGVHGADPLSVARIEQVAGEIHRATGLAVDITAGSSPQPETIALPAGRYGRPPLTLTEGWAKKGAAVEILDALDTKTLALTLLILLTAAGFVAIATTANIRLRRTEIGVLRCLGWRRADILAALLTELAVIAVAAGALGAGVSAAAIALLHLPVDPIRILLTPAVALGLALAAGAATAAPAIRATSPLAAVNPTAPTLGRARHGRRGRALPSLLRLAAANLLRHPGRSLAAASAIFLGTAALAVLLVVNLAFRGTVTGTLLGTVVNLQIRPVDYVCVAVVLALATLAVLDVLLLSLRERAAELAVLRATGWARGQLARLTVYEASSIGAGAGILGGITGAILGLLLHAPAASTALAFAAATGVGFIVATTAALLPAIATSRLPISPLLAEE